MARDVKALRKINENLSQKCQDKDNKCIVQKPCMHYESIRYQLMMFIAKYKCDRRFFSEKTSTCRLGAMGEFELLDKVRDFQVKKWKRRDQFVYIVMKFIISIIFFLYLYSFCKIQNRHN